MSDDRSRHIQQRAYAIWEQQGRPHGRHEDHWRQAESEVAGGGASAAQGLDDGADPPMAQAFVIIEAVREE